jgi:hypothetical protein
MLRDRFQRVEELFQAAFELPEEMRSSFIAGAAGDDEALSSGVLRLLARADSEAPLPTLRDERHADSAESGGCGDAPAIDRVGAKIGQYTLRQLIGEGGFGAVYLAEQERPVRRRVALKII